ncbi:hypothetical protein BC828DRAFT_389223 [Blastocladiella britannica]|nr:hypothetical protein BC828DRAFT_389223 [Blastocladiella britannica]
MQSNACAHTVHQEPLFLVLHSIQRTTSAKFLPGLPANSINLPFFPLAARRVLVAHSSLALSSIQQQNNKMQQALDHFLTLASPLAPHAPKGLSPRSRTRAAAPRALLSALAMLVQRASRTGTTIDRDGTLAALGQFELAMFGGHCRQEATMRTRRFHWSKPPPKQLQQPKEMARRQLMAAAESLVKTLVSLPPASYATSTHLHSLLTHALPNADDHTCPICLEIHVRPVRMRGCSHHVCGTCWPALVEATIAARPPGAAFITFTGDELRPVEWSLVPPDAAAAAVALDRAHSVSAAAGSSTAAAILDSDAAPSAPTVTVTDEDETEQPLQPTPLPLDRTRSTASSTLGAPLPLDRTRSTASSSIITLGVPIAIGRTGTFTMPYASPWLPETSSSSDPPSRRSISSTSPSTYSSARSRHRRGSSLSDKVLPRRASQMLDSIRTKLSPTRTAGHGVPLMLRVPCPVCRRVSALRAVDALANAHYSSKRAAVIVDRDAPLVDAAYERMVAAFFAADVRDREQPSSQFTTKEWMARVVDRLRLRS